MKSVLIDVYKIKYIYSGLGQFSINFLQELLNHHLPGFDINFLIPRKKNIKLDTHINQVETSFQKRYFSCFNQNYDIWHSLHQFPSHLPNKKTKHILTVHDLNFLIEKKGKKRDKILRRLQKNVDRADYITAISKYTGSILKKYIDLKEKKIYIIYNGVKLNTYKNMLPPLFMGNHRFFFSIGIFSFKKNFHVLLPMMKHFENYQLVIAGDNKTFYGEKIKSQIAQYGLHEKVILPGNISDEEKVWLYNNCTAFLFPSLAEGFGLPVIEAMMVGKPVFLSKLTSLPEIGGPFAFYFDSFNAEHMYSLISDKLTHFEQNKKQLSKEIRKHAARYNWKECMKKYVDLYISVID